MVISAWPCRPVHRRPAGPPINPARVMAMRPSWGAALEVVEPKFLLHLLVSLFTDPSIAAAIDSFLQER